MNHPAVHSPRFDAFVPPPLAVPRWLITCRALWRAWRRRVDEREQILRFTQRELRDAGLTSGDVYRELATPFWKTGRS